VLLITYHFLSLPCYCFSYTWNLKDSKITFIYLPWVRSPSSHNVIHNNTPQRMCNHRYFATPRYEIWVSLCEHCVQPIQFLGKTTLNLQHRRAIQSKSKIRYSVKHLDQCFSTARPRPGTGPWHQLYRAARESPGIDN